MSTTISRYAGRGVSSSKEDVHAAIRHIDKGLYPKAFCKIIPDTLSGDPEACLVMHADGAGTKSALAYAYWRETGDASVWKGIAQASYEDEYNGGMGSNGLTSARHDVFARILAEKYPETYDPETPSDLVYSGKYRLTDTVPGCPLTVGKLVLSPTRTYAPVVRAILDEHRGDIRGMVHCSGGGQTKILHFVDRLHIIKDNLFDTPLLFRLIQQESQTPWREMYSVFNMGHRMEIYADPAAADDIVRISKGFGIDARVIGRVEEADRASVTIRHEGRELNYAK